MEWKMAKKIDGYIKLMIGPARREHYGVRQGI